MDVDRAPESPRALVARLRERLAAAGIEEARRNAEWIAADVLGCRLSALYVLPDHPIPDAKWALAYKHAARRARREPLQYVLGYSEFYGLPLHVTPDVLIPRPETEEVVEAALDVVKDVPGLRVLDIGTGSGCMALAIRSERPDALVSACDLSREALVLAAENSSVLGLPVRFFAGDLLDDGFAGSAEGPYELIVSNPPYIPDHERSSLESEVRDFEPALALFSGDDPLLFYRRLAEVGQDLLMPGGHMVVETHADYAGGAAALFHEGAYAYVETRRDLAGRPRMVIARR